MPKTIVMDWEEYEEIQARMRNLQHLLLVEGHKQERYFSALYNILSMIEFYAKDGFDLSSQAEILDLLEHEYPEVLEQLRDRHNLYQLFNGLGKG